MTRLEIRKRALRAATAVSLTTLTLAVFGCDGGVSVETTADDGADDPPAPRATATTTHTATPPVPDIGPIVPLFADAGTDAPACNCPHDQSWADCCAAVNWSFECGCEAWGPPMPPSMETV
ncbi:MAG: hypothetical protein ABI193_15650 [Minicystis sp.]